MNAMYSCLHAFVPENKDSEAGKFVVLVGIVVKLDSILCTFKLVYPIPPEQDLTCVVQKIVKDDPKLFFGLPPNKDEIYNQINNSVVLKNNQLFLKHANAPDEYVCPYVIPKFKQKQYSFVQEALTAHILSFLPSTVAKLSMSQMFTLKLKTPTVETEHKEVFSVPRDTIVKALKLHLPATHGHFQRVAVLDFDSLYPNILTKHPWCLGDPRANTHFYQILEDCLRLKKKARDSHQYQVARQCKVLANTMYGLLAYRDFPYARPETCFLVRKQGQMLLEKSKNVVMAEFGDQIEVVGGKTDSLFIRLCFPQISLQHDILFLERIKSTVEATTQHDLKIEHFFQSCIFTSTAFIGATATTGELVCKGSVVNRAKFTEVEKREFEAFLKILLCDTGTGAKEKLLDLIQHWCFHTQELQLSRDWVKEIVKIIHTTEFASLSNFFEFL